MLKKLLREPLVHFIIIGGLFFLIYQWLNPVTQSAQSITVSEARVNQLIKHFQRTWKREPSSEELASVVNNHVLDEIYYREAKALGIDDNDEVIRRRLRQKMEFMIADAAALSIPDDQELENFYRDNAHKYRQDPRYTFSQVLINTDRSPRQLETIIAQQQARIERNLEPVGDSTLLPPYFEAAPSFDIDRRFGQGFALQLNELAIGVWSGPIRSGLGLHFVKIDNKEAGAVPALADVKDKVLDEWRYQQNQTAKRLHQQQLLNRYSVNIDWPQESAAEIAGESAENSQVGE